jgi:hypothetical protein
MEHTAVRRRFPRAGIDAIDDARIALATIALAIGRPFRHETIVILLDEARRGRTIVVVSGTADPDSVIEVVECVTQGDGCEHIGGVVVCSVRPATAGAGKAIRPAINAAIDGVAADGVAADEVAVDDILDGDVDRWLEMSDIASLAGIELIEWFVVGRTISCPRDRLGEPPRW